jgi:hypothetical protein
VCGVLDNAAGLLQAVFQVDVLDGWEHNPSYVLGCLHHPLKSLADVDRGIPVPGRDATGQDALNGAVVVFGEDLGGIPNLFSQK